MKSKLVKLYHLLKGKKTLTTRDIETVFNLKRNTFDFAVLNSARSYYYEFLEDIQITEAFFHFLIDQNEKVHQLFAISPEQFKNFDELKNAILTLSVSNTDTIINNRDLSIEIERQIALFNSNMGKYEIKILGLSLDIQKYLIALNIKTIKPNSTKEPVLKEATQLLHEETSKLLKAQDQVIEDKRVGLKIEKENHIERKTISLAEMKQFNLSLKEFTKELAILVNLPLPIINQLNQTDKESLNNKLQEALKIREEEIIYSDSAYTKGTTLEQLQLIIHECKQLIRNVGISIPANIPVVIVEAETAEGCISNLTDELKHLKSKKRVLENERKKLLQNTEYRRALQYNGLSEIKKKQLVIDYEAKISDLKQELAQAKQEFNQLFEHNE